MKIEELLALGITGSGGTFVKDGVLIGVAQPDGTVKLYPEAEELLKPADVPAAAPAPAPRGRKPKAEPAPVEAPVVIPDNDD